MQTKQNQGHGFFRKSKAYGLVAGIALSGALLVSNGTTFADEVKVTDTKATNTEVSTQPKTTNDKDSYKKQANSNTAAQKVTIDNSKVTNAVTKAQDAGVVVTKEATQDKGTATTSSDYDKAQSEIKADQESQVAKIEKATKEAQENKAAAKEAEASFKAVKDQVTEAKKNGINVVSENVETGDGSATTLKAATEKAKQIYNENQAAINSYNSKMNEIKSTPNVSVEGRVTTQDADQLIYGNTVMNGGVEKDGSFSFTHDMNDSANDTLGVMGYGTLKGKVNFSSKANADGSTTVNISSLDLYSYVYTNNRPNTAVNQNISYHVYHDGQEVYSVAHDGNNDFTNAINKNVAVNKSYTIKPGEATPLVPLLNIDDLWIINTHGQLALKFTNNNVLPTATIKDISGQVRNKTVNVAYHDYSLKYAPKVTKTVADSDKTNTDKQTVAKNGEQVYTLVHDNIYSNIKNGDTITIVDPLTAGATPNEAKTKSLSEASGWKVDYNKAKYTYTFTATYNGKKLKAPQIVWAPTYDKGFYENTYKVLVNDYTAYSNTVTNYTPEPPKPVKSITDEKGADINGATTFNKNVKFNLTTDYSTYTKTTASKEAIVKGFYILDDVEDNKFKVKDSEIKVTDSKKNDVKELFEMYHVLSDDARTDAINKILKQAGLNPKGEFYLWAAKNPSTFYSKYVKTNNNINIELPAELTAPDGTKITNNFQQVDFGNPYTSNLVEVETPNLKPSKKVVDAAKADAKDLNDKTVLLNQVIDYYLDGVTIPAKHDTLTQYDLVDKLDTEHDEYTGNWKVIITASNTTTKETVLENDVKDENGKVYKAGDKIPIGTKYSYQIELTQDSKNADKYVSVTYKDGVWKASAKDELLSTVDNTSTFDMDAYVEVKRIKSGDAYNEFTNVVNGKEMISNKVVTHTPEPPKPTTPPDSTTPPKPNTPTPNTPTPNTPNKPKPIKTPATATGLALGAIGFMTTSVMSLFGLAKRKED